MPKEIPVIATHVWPAQAAVHAGMKRVINAVPDNWPMAFAFVRGQYSYGADAFLPTKATVFLNGMDKNKVLNPMPKDSLVYTGHYIDHELVQGIEEDCAARRARKMQKKPMRFLFDDWRCGCAERNFCGDYPLFNTAYQGRTCCTVCQCGRL